MQHGHPWVMCTRQGMLLAGVVQPAVRFLGFALVVFGWFGGWVAIHRSGFLVVFTSSWFVSTEGCQFNPQVQRLAGHVSAAHVRG